MASSSVTCDGVSSCAAYVESQVSNVLPVLYRRSASTRLSVSQSHSVFPMPFSRSTCASLPSGAYVKAFE